MQVRLIRFFKEHGQLRSIRLMRDPDTKDLNGRATIEFGKIETVNEVSFVLPVKLWAALAEPQSSSTIEDLVQIANKSLVLDGAELNIEKKTEYIDHNNIQRLEPYVQVGVAVARG